MPNEASNAAGEQLIFNVIFLFFFTFKIFAEFLYTFMSKHFDLRGYIFLYKKFFNKILLATVIVHTFFLVKKCVFLGEKGAEFFFMAPLDSLPNI